MASVTIDIKSKLNKALRDKLDTINNNPTTMLAIHNTLAKMCDPYVPFLEGPLSQTAVVSPTGVTYIQPYARYQYYGDDFNHTTEYHPLASARWNEAMMRDRGDEFVKEVEDILHWRMTHGGGR